MKDSNDEKFGWIKEIIYTNIIAKLRGKSFANIIDVGSQQGNLIKKLSQSFPDSRLYYYSQDEKDKGEENSKEILKTRADVDQHSYDLILSVFDLHRMTEIEILLFLKFINEISSTRSTLIISDIATEGFVATLILKIASFFNSRLKSFLPIEDISAILQQNKFTIKDTDKYKINNIWSGWIITAEKI